LSEKREKGRSKGTSETIWGEGGKLIKKKTKTDSARRGESQKILGRDKRGTD